MKNIDYSRKIPAKVIDADIASFHGLSFVTNYIPVRSEAAPEELKNAMTPWLPDSSKKPN
jgi:hypothetical protein